MVEEPKTLDVFVDKGMSNGQKITFSGEGDQYPDTVPGDVIIVLQQEAHPTFTRQGNDLHVHKTITLLEALCGFKYLFTHLDARVLLIKSQPGEVIKNGEVKCIEGEGMPQHKNPFEKGNLYVTFDIEFPKSISEEHMKILSTILPQPEPIDEALLKDEHEEVVAKSFTASNGKGTKKGRRGHRHHFHGEEEEEGEEDGEGEYYVEEDDEDGGGHHGPHGIPCAQQ